MKFTLEYKLQGPAGTNWVPNTQNPVEAIDLAEVLQKLVNTGLPPMFAGVRIIGIRIQEAE
jgi:hypothetical protein